MMNADNVNNVTLLNLYFIISIYYLQLIYR